MMYLIRRLLIPVQIREMHQGGNDIGPLDLLGPGASRWECATNISAPSSINVGRVNAGDVRSVGPVDVSAIDPGTVDANDVFSRESECRTIQGLRI